MKESTHYLGDTQYFDVSGEGISPGISRDRSKCQNLVYRLGSESIL